MLDISSKCFSMLHMARKPTGNPCGPPPREFDKKVFEELCFIQCTHTEIGSVLHAHPDTVDRWCKKAYGESLAECKKKFAEGGRSSLRRDQFKMAKKSAAMAIWLGKQYLNQRDHPLDEEGVGAKVEELLDMLHALKKKQENKIAYQARKEERKAQKAVQSKPLK